MLRSLPHSLCGVMGAQMVDSLVFRSFVLSFILKVLFVQSIDRKMDTHVIISLPALANLNSILEVDIPVDAPLNSVLCAQRQRRLQLLRLIQLLDMHNFQDFRVRALCALRSHTVFCHFVQIFCAFSSAPAQRVGCTIAQEQNVGWPQALSCITNTRIFQKPKPHHD